MFNGCSGRADVGRRYNISGLMGPSGRHRHAQLLALAKLTRESRQFVATILLMAEPDDTKIATRAKRKTEPAAETSTVDRFADELCDLRLDADASERFCQAADEWMNSVWLALEVATRLAVADQEELAGDDNQTCLDDLLSVCASHFKPDLDGAYAELLVIGRDAGCRYQMEKVLRTAMAGLQEFLSAASAPAVTVAHPNGGSTMLGARASVFHALEELRRLRPLLASGLRQRSQPTPRQLEIWGLLRGQALFDKEIAVQLSSHSSAGSVRNQIKCLRDGGWPIEHASGIGYYRTDAPPPNLN